MHKEVFTEDMAIEFFNYLREMEEDESDGEQNEWSK
jgi:hypothetical protein